MVSSDGSVFVGGNGNILTKLDKDFKSVSSNFLGDKVLCGITVKQQIICGMRNSESLRVFDNSLKLIEEIKLKNIPKKLLLLED